MFTAIVAAARVRGMLDDPLVLTASQWQDWLHPRGKDGKFIQKNSWVNIFANGSDGINDRSAPRRRARIVELRPDGAFVQYVDPTKLDAQGKATVVPADAAAGFPDLIPVNTLSAKVSSAPKAIAQLQPHESASKEFADSHVPAMTAAQYEEQIAGVNRVNAAEYPEQAQIVAAGQGPISDEDFESHVAFVSMINQQVAFRPVSAELPRQPGKPTEEKRVSQAGHSLTYDSAFKDSYGLWSDEMQEVFDDLVDQTFNEVTANQSKPKNRRAIVLGGLPGAGKSSTLKAMQDQQAFHEDEWITVNPDHFKDKMFETGHYPKIEGLAPAETASFIHEASSEMNHMLEQLLMAEGYNVIFDVTMGGRAEAGKDNWADMLMGSLKQQGYVTDGIFVDAEAQTVRQRVRARHKEGLDALRTGQTKRGRGDDDTSVKFGGRVVPDAVIAAGEIDASDANHGVYSSLNAVNFNRIKSVFARWSIWDNNGDVAFLVQTSAKDPNAKEEMAGYYQAQRGEAPAAGGEGDVA